MKKLVCLALLLAPLSTTWGNSLAEFDFAGGFTPNALLTGVASAVLSTAMPLSLDMDPTDNAIDDGSYLLSGGLLYLDRNAAGSGWGFANTSAPFSVSLTASVGYVVTVESFTFSKLQADGAGFTSSAHFTQVRFSADSPLSYGATASVSGGVDGTATASLPTPVAIASGTTVTFLIDMNSNNGQSQHLHEGWIINGSAVLPEPATSALLVFGLGALGLARRHR